MQDDLVGFVLGALDSAEEQEIRRRMEQESDLRLRVQRVERALRPLREAAVEVDPPAGLADRTCARIWELMDPRHGGASADGNWGLGLGRGEVGTRPFPSGTEATDRLTQGRGRGSDDAGVRPADSGAANAELRRRTAWEETRTLPVAHRRSAEGSLAPSERTSGPADAAGVERAATVRSRSGASSGSRGSSVGESAGSSDVRHWTFADLTVALGVCIAASCLFFPALVNSRWHAQLAACQNNLRQVSAALVDYSGRNGGYFPMIPAQGNLSRAGAYAVMLREKGLLDDGRLLHCPGKPTAVALTIPTYQDVLMAQGPQLVTLHRSMGGDYAYNFGYVWRGRLQGVRNQGRVHMALLADSPFESFPTSSIGAHGQGQNVLFEDGHVAFLMRPHRPGRPNDHLFLNAAGERAAGRDPEDVVLGSSDLAPVPVSFTIQGR